MADKKMPRGPMMRQGMEQPRRKKSTNVELNTQRFMKILLYIVMALFLVFIGDRAYKYYELRTTQQKMQQEIDNLREQNAKLEEEKAKLQDPKEIEDVARKELGMVKPNEVPYIK